MKIKSDAFSPTRYTILLLRVSQALLSFLAFADVSRDKHNSLQDRIDMGFKPARPPAFETTRINNGGSDTRFNYTFSGLEERLFLDTWEKLCEFLSEQLSLGNLQRTRA